MAFNAIASRTVLGAGYSVARTSMYLVGTTEVADIAIDGNDLEDYYISLHLGLDSGRVLVTNDVRTRDAINRTLTAFREYGASCGTSFETNAQVMTSDEFLACVETGRSQTPAN